MDWKRIKAEYIAGGISYRKLAEKHGVSFNTLKTHAIEEKWHQLRQQANHKATTKMVETISQKEAKRVININDVADKLLEKINDVIIGRIFDTQGIKHISSALKDIKDIKGFKSDADMREQEARIKNLEKQAMSDNTVHDVTVTIAGGDASWQE